MNDFTSSVSSKINSPTSDARRSYGQWQNKYPVKQKQGNDKNYFLIIYNNNMWICHCAVKYNYGTVHVGPTQYTHKSDWSPISGKTFVMYPSSTEMWTIWTISSYLSDNIFSKINIRWFPTRDLVLILIVFLSMFPLSNKYPDPYHMYIVWLTGLVGWHHTKPPSIIVYNLLFSMREGTSLRHPSRHVVWLIATSLGQGDSRSDVAWGVYPIKT